MNEFEWIKQIHQHWIVHAGTTKGISEWLRQTINRSTAPAAAGHCRISFHICARLPIFILSYLQQGNNNNKIEYISVESAKNKKKQTKTSTLFNAAEDYNRIIKKRRKKNGKKSINWKFHQRKKCATIQNSATFTFYVFICASAMSKNRVRLHFSQSQIDRIAEMHTQKKGRYSWQQQNVEWVINVLHPHD